MNRLNRRSSAIKGATFNYYAKTEMAVKSRLVSKTCCGFAPGLEVISIVSMFLAGQFEATANQVWLGERSVVAGG